MAETKPNSMREGPLAPPHPDHRTRHHSITARNAAGMTNWAPAPPKKNQTCRRQIASLRAHISPQHVLQSLPAVALQCKRNWLHMPCRFCGDWLSCFLFELRRPMLLYKSHTCDPKGNDCPGVDTLSTLWSIKFTIAVCYHMPVPMNIRLHNLQRVT